MHLAATDMELSLRSSLEAQIEGDGAVVVPGRLLVDLVRLLPDNEVTIEHRGDEDVVRIDVGPSIHAAHLCGGGLSAAARSRRAGPFTVDRESMLDTVARVAAPLRATSRAPC